MREPTSEPIVCMYEPLQDQRFVRVIYYSTNRADAYNLLQDRPVIFDVAVHMLSLIHI